MNNFNKYQEYTTSRNWEGICKLNKLSLDSFGTKKELRALPDFLQESEVVFALASGLMSQTSTSNSSDFGINTWLAVLTNQRFLFLDAAMLTSSVDTQSVRLDHVQAVSASQGLLLGKISIDLGSRMITIDNCDKKTVPIFVELSNKWLNELEENKKSSLSRDESTTVFTPLDKLEQLWKMNSFGALNDDEYEMAKTRLISSAEFQAMKDKLLSSF